MDSKQLMAQLQGQVILLRKRCSLHKKELDSYRGRRSVARITAQERLLSTQTNLMAAEKRLRELQVKVLVADVFEENALAHDLQFGEKVNHVTRRTENFFSCRVVCGDSTQDKQISGWMDATFEITSWAHQ